MATVGICGGLRILATPKDHPYKTTAAWKVHQSLFKSLFGRKGERVADGNRSPVSSRFECFEALEIVCVGDEPDFWSGAEATIANGGLTTSDFDLFRDALAVCRPDLDAVARVSALSALSKE